MRDGWIDWNLGIIDRPKLMNQYSLEPGMTQEELKKLFTMIEETQEVLPGAYQLLEELHSKGFQLYSITDNTKELIAYHRKHSNFMHFFKDVVVSAEIGVLKPAREIYQELLERNNLTADSCVFFDDMELNVRGANAVGINGILFTTIDEARATLAQLGVVGQNHSDL